jgi:multiple sugar transport system substrate-binding protein
MGRIFGVIFLLLIAASAGIYFYIPDLRSQRPVLYWVTNTYPQQRDQVQEFYRWLIANGHTTPDGRPCMELRIDSDNDDFSKILIQGISGDCGDIVEQSSFGLQILHQAGMLEDVTDAAKAHGFDVSHTYPALRAEMVYDGRQYSFPRQVYGFVYVANDETFRKYGMTPPPMRWNLDEFEKIGKQFVEAANPPGKRRSVFFANEVRDEFLWRSFGLSIFNERMTRCTLDDPRFAQTLTLIHKWTFDDHLFPTAADLQSVATKSETQFGDSRIQMFVDGEYAMVFIGRHGLPLIRPHGKIPMSVSEPPNGGFPNTSADGTEVAVYAGSKHPELAELFLQYIASKEFSDAISVSADAVPPNPAATQTAAYLRPAAYPNEWGMHEKFSQVINDIGIGEESSPYVLTLSVYLAELDAREAFMGGLCTAQQAGERVAQHVNAELARNLEDNPELREEYAKDVALQARIDKLRTEGKKVPLAWISNPFYRKYYQAMGWADTSTDGQ